MTESGRSRGKGGFVSSGGGGCAILFRTVDVGEAGGVRGSGDIDVGGGDFI